MRSVVILGSTGSIGTQALQVIAAQPGRFEVVGLAAGGSSVVELAAQVLEHQPRVVGLTRATAVQDLQLALYAEAQRRGWNAGEMQLPRIVAGPESASEVAGTDCDVVLNAITGSAGLMPTLRVLAGRARLALANKESLVIGGRLVLEAADPDQLVAVDSEHSAIAQCLRAGRGDEVDRVVLTASGGPFRGRSRDELRDVTPAEALRHPTWDMGRVITINSATLVNKGLELLEAHLLYGVPLARIDVVVHPQSVVHSMVQFVDGSTIAQCSPPDMALPIALGLSWPDRLAGVAQPCDWTAATSWTFEPLDDDAFPAVRLARLAGEAAGTAPAVYNAANEVCVDAFCAGRLDFSGIVHTIEAVLAEHLSGAPGEIDERAEGDDPAGHHVQDSALSVEAVLGADAWARRRAAALTAAALTAADDPSSGTA